jgi:cathepsin B
MPPQADAADRARAAAAKRSGGGKQKGNSKTQYVLWIGGASLTIVIACIMLVINPDRGPWQIPVNDGNLIAHVNRNAKTWRAGASSFFEGWTIGDAKLLEGSSISQMGGAVGACPVLEGAVPDRFDSREKWPQCFNYPIYNMLNCTASWAIATASALSNRFCVGSPTEYSELMLSPQQLLSCDTMQRGCSGGDIDTAWSYIEREGLVSELCFPYQGDGSVSCQSKCTTEAPLKAASHCVLNNEMAVKREIFNHGPVVAAIFLMDDFLVYRSGLYQEMPTATQLSDQRRQRIIHTVKIIGWGEMAGTNYWLIENSWGEDWGEHGYAKIVAGGSPEKREGIIIESYILAGVPANQKVSDDLDDLDPDFEEDGGDLDDIDVELEDDPEKSDDM